MVGKLNRFNTFWIFGSKMHLVYLKQLNLYLDRNPNM